MFTMNTDPKWIKNKMAMEVGDDILSGTLAAELSDMFSARPLETTKKDALSKLVELYRRDKKMTVEQFAQKLDIDIEELLNIERASWDDIDPRTIYNLANEIHVSPKKISDLAGLTVTTKPSFDKAVIHFAAQSENMNSLTSMESKALRDFVKELATES